jgi:homoserine kinase type II
LTLYEKRVRESDLPYFLGLMDHLAVRGVRCPVPVRRRDGAMWTKANGKPAALLTYLEGLSLNRPETADCAAAAAACARMHEAGRGFSLSRTNALGPRGWRKLGARELRPTPTTVQQGLGVLIAQTLARRSNGTGRSGSARRRSSTPICFPTMSCSWTAGSSGLIDFYFACNDCVTPTTSR